jgi:two-component system, NarL family, sensor kinase
MKVTRDLTMANIPFSQYPRQSYSVFTKIFLIALFIGNALTSSSQNFALDSLESKVDQLSGVQKASALYELVYGYARIDLEKAKLYLGQVTNWIKEDPKGETLSYLMLAQGVYHSRTGQLDSAVYLLNVAKKTAIETKSTAVQIKIIAGLAYSYISSGKPEKGLENLFEGLRLLNARPDPEMEFKMRTNIGWAHLELKQYRECIREGLENLRRMQGTPFEYIAHYNYNNIAVSYGAVGILDSAHYFIEKGIESARAKNDNQSLANAYFILGTIYANAKKPDLAIQQYLKARPHREKVGNPLFIVSDLYAISELYFLTGEYEKGVQAGEEALTMAKKYNLLLKFEGTYHSLAQNYEGLKDFKNASRYYKLWAMAKDTVYKHSNAEAIAEMQTRFDTEKKEQQLVVQRVELANQQVQLERTYVVIGALCLILFLILIIYLLFRSRQDRIREAFIREAQIHATIQSQETERRRFARDLHDGMGQLISALRIAIHTVNHNSPLEERVQVVQKAEGLLNDMHKEIRSIAFNLMPQTLVQNGLIPALKEMSMRINESGVISTRVSGYDIPERLPELVEISLYRIIQEWTNNIIKYASATVVEIQLVGHEEEISVVLEDNGRGFDVLVLEQSIGNGWKNIRSRLNLIRGSIEIDSRPERSGTIVTIRIPFDNQRVNVGPMVQINTQ